MSLITNQGYALHYEQLLAAFPIDFIKVWNIGIGTITFTFYKLMLRGR